MRSAFFAERWLPREARLPDEEDALEKLGILDTHSHFQAARFDADRERLCREARGAGVESMLLCSAGPDDWANTAQFAHAHGFAYGLGIHPLFIADVVPEDLHALREAAARAKEEDPFFIAVGEIGLDGGKSGFSQNKAEAIFAEILKIARDFQLPVSLHVRKSASKVLKHLRRCRPAGGVVHAFNGSDAERRAFLELGLKLGFGGSAAYEGSVRIRRHLSELSSDEWVAETDSPDMPSGARRAWAAAAGIDPLAEPADIRVTLAAAASLRGLDLGKAAAECRRNALAAFPRWRALLARSDAFAKRID